MKKFSWIKVLIFIILLAGVIFFWLFFKVIEAVKSLPDPQQFIADHVVSQSSKIYANDGTTLLYEIYNQEKRTVLSADKIPDYMKKATISIEDKNFYNHNAIDWRAMLRALFIDILKGHIAQGGSTITQQLAKNAFLTTDRTMDRKIREILLAFQIEKRYSKDEILNMYLNQISYGSNIYGIEAASQAYFNKSAENLTLAECALLASLPKAPSYYSPWGMHTDELMQRKDYILRQMFDMNFIDQEQYNAAKNEKIVFTNQNLGVVKAPHFVAMVKDYLENKYGDDFLNKGGLKITTTLDYGLQQIAEDAVKKRVSLNAQLYNGKNAALVAQDAKTGDILALVGSADYFDKANEGNFNVAVQGLRQPGSAMKPIVYAEAFRKGYTPDTVIFDLPTEFASNNPNCPAAVDFNNDNQECYHPENYDHKFDGPISFRNALAQSRNIPGVKVLYLAGLNDTLSLAQDMGITTLKDPSRYGLSLVLGGGEVKLIDLVNAYSVFSQDGIRHNQKIILKVEDANGNVIESNSDQMFQVLDSQVAREINSVLSDQEARSPLYSASLGLTVFPDSPDISVALKTGTTNDYRDAWTIGYTPSLVAGVWAGNNHQEPMIKNAGSILAALPIWNAFMKEVLKKYPAESFNKPAELSSQIIKPMLNGDIVLPAHDILYYVDKSNPLGDPPQNPANDPQYENWEYSVQKWNGASSSISSN